MLALTAFRGSDAGLYWSCLGASLAVLVWNAAAGGLPGSHDRRIVVSLRAQHYLQACAQGTVFVYWLAYWPQAPSYFWLLIAQLLFAYAIDMLVTWSRQDEYTLGFGPWPIVFSINLFLLFKEPWFAWQFATVAMAFAGKVFVRWDSQGRRRHIFNPSALALAVTSVALIATGATNTTWGQEIAITQFYPPNMYLVLFLVGLPGQLLFGVTSMTMAAVVSTYAAGLLYFAATGLYLFYDSYVPIAVFLGMHLLFTDPSTSPRSELGRVIYGVLYGLSTTGLYVVLTGMGVPTFYDKLFPVPLLNLAAPMLDRLAAAPVLHWIDPARIGPSIQGRQRNLAFMGVWTLVFFIMSRAQGVGDRHPGQWIPFWEQACASGRQRACSFLQTRLTSHCAEGSGWACNEVGLRAGGASAADPTPAGASFERGCELGFRTACDNLLRIVDHQGTPQAAPPGAADYPIILRGSKREIVERQPEALARIACGQGWPGTCGATAP